MSILNNLNRGQQAHRRQPQLTSEAGLIAEYDAVRRAYASALACNNMESALLWSERANRIAQQMAQMDDCASDTWDDSSAHDNNQAKAVQTLARAAA